MKMSNLHASISVEKDGLAGVDINNASVVIIDYQSDDNNGNYLNGHRNNIVSVQSLVSDTEAGDFEEVLSKKSKRQRLQQIEEQRKKIFREKERQEKILAKRYKQVQKRVNAKKG